MMREYVPLGSVAHVEHGWPFRSSQYVEPTNVASIPRVVSIGNFSYSGGFRGQFKGYAGEYPASYELEPGDLLLVMTCQTAQGEILGLPAAVPEDGYTYLHNQRIGRVVIDDHSALDSRFLFYVALTREFNHQLFLTASGTKILHTAPIRIEACRVPRPSLSDQQAIGEVLGALDDKMAANRLVLSGTERLLRARFQELSAGPSSTRRPVTDFIEFNPRCGATKSQVAFVDMQKLPLSASMIENWSRREAPGGARFCNGDTLLARITPCLENGKVGFVDFLAHGETGAGSTEFIVMRASPGVAAPVSFFIATDDEFRSHAIQHMYGTSGRQRVAARDLESFEIGLPTVAEMHGFGRIATSAFRHLGSLRDQNRHLATLRDTLLPHLMSGRLTVRQAEQVVSEAL